MCEVFIMMLRVSLFQSLHTCPTGCALSQERRPVYVSVYAACWPVYDVGRLIVPDDPHAGFGIAECLLIHEECGTSPETEGFRLRVQTSELAVGIVLSWMCDEGTRI